jgi:hypothetical protein
MDDAYSKYGIEHIDLGASSFLDWNQPISLTETIENLQVLRSNSAAGPDGISYNILKALPIQGNEMICDILNECFQTGRMPLEFLQAIQLPIPKTDGSYRPLTLSNCIQKLYEKILYSRLLTWAERHVPNFQYGFRAKRGAADQVFNLVQFCQEQQIEKKYSLILFLDIKKAFDRTDKRTLLVKLHKLGIQGKILQGIKNCIQSRYVRVVLENHGPYISLVLPQ